MIRIAIVLGCVCALASSGTAMVGGAPPTSEGAGRAVVMLTGSHGTFCSGVALGRELVLTAAHCVLPGADYSWSNSMAHDSLRSKTSRSSRGIPTST